MRRPLLAALLLLLAAPAQAGVLSSATLTFEVGSLPALTLTASGVVGEAPSDTQAILGASTAFATSTTVLLPPTLVPPITQVQYVVGPNPVGLFSGTTPGDLRGTMALTGHICGAAVQGLICILPLPILWGRDVQSFFSSYGVTFQATGHTWKASTTTVVLTTPTTNGATVATLTLNFVPEPRTGLLLPAAALAVLALRLNR